MSSEINRAIELIDEKIEALQKVRDTLVEMFDPPNSLRRRLLATRGNAVPSTTPTPLDSPTPSDVLARSDALAVVTAPGTNLVGPISGNGKMKRKDEVATFIRDHGGSASRAEIIAGTGIPKGTVAYVLNDVSRFRRRDHKWHVREQRDSARTSAE